MCQRTGSIHQTTKIEVGCYNFLITMLTCMRQIMQLVFSLTLDTCIKSCLGSIICRSFFIVILASCLKSLCVMSSKYSFKFFNPAQQNHYDTFYLLQSQGTPSSSSSPIVCIIAEMASWLALVTYFSCTEWWSFNVSKPHQVFPSTIPPPHFASSEKTGRIYMYSTASI